MLLCLCADLQDLAELALNLLERAKLFVDAGYNFYEWEDYSREIEELRLQVPRKANSKRAREPWLEIYKSLMRKYIETTIGGIPRLFPKKTHATSLIGFLLKKSPYFYSPVRLIKRLSDNWQLGQFELLI